MKLKLLKKEKHFTKKEFVFNTNFYWMVITAIAGVMIILSGIFGYYLFKSTNQVDTAAVAASASAPLLKEGILEKALQYFTDRQQRTNQILNSPSPVVDPSL